MSHIYVFVISILVFSLVIISTPLIKAALEYQVGVSPIILDLGEVERGTSSVHSFFLVTQSTEEILVKMSSSRGVLDFFNKPGYGKLIYNYSEENPSSWVEFLENPVTIEPLGGGLETIGGNVKGARRVNFILNVPEDAEPGYHLVVITPEPYVPKYLQNRANIVAIVSVSVLFKIEGEAIRSGHILDISKGKDRSGGFEIRTFFHNNGTVTVSSRVEELKLFDHDGIVINTARSNIDSIKPGETKPLISFSSYNGLEESEYEVEANANFHTGRSVKKSTIFLKEDITGAIPREAEGGYFPFEIIIIVIIIIIAYKIYKRN